MSSKGLRHTLDAEFIARRYFREVGEGWCVPSREPAVLQRGDSRVDYTRNSTSTFRLFLDSGSECCPCIFLANISHYSLSFMGSRSVCTFCRLFIFHLYRRSSLCEDKVLFFFLQTLNSGTKLHPGTSFSNK